MWSALDGATYPTSVVEVAPTARSFEVQPPGRPAKSHNNRRCFFGDSRNCWDWRVPDDSRMLANSTGFHRAALRSAAMQSELFEFFHKGSLGEKVKPLCSRRSLNTESEKSETSEKPASIKVGLTTTNSTRQLFRVGTRMVGD